MQKIKRVSLGAFLAFCFASAMPLPAAPVFVLDQVGYLLDAPKVALLKLDPGAVAARAFQVRAEPDGKIVFQGNFGPPRTDAAAGDTVQAADFSALHAEGAYRLEAEGVEPSAPFQIGAAVYADAYRLAARAFYGQRCGMAVDLGEVDGVRYRHEACHTHGAASDLPATMHPSSGRTGTRASDKGWHDAGDYGKYVVNAGITLGELFWALERFGGKIGNVGLNLPESGNGLPDLLNESRWELDWLLSMQDDDGGVWTKESSARFGGFTLPEDDDAGTRFIIGTDPAPGRASTPGKTTCATADFAAVLAAASRLYRPYDPAFADACLGAAVRAYAWVRLHPDVIYVQPVSGPPISTGAYRDADPSDERLWAAAELHRATGEPSYAEDFERALPGGELLKPGELPQDWRNVRALALWSYYFGSAEGKRPGLLKRIQKDTLRAADAAVAHAAGDDNPYRVSLAPNQYIWGSNGAVANFAVLLLTADAMTPKAAYRDAALDDLHYLFGRNTHGACFVTHLGTRPVLHPHHRPSGSPAYRDQAPWPGLLSGGPNATGARADHVTPDDPHPARCWIDATRSYASNEVAINWQAALVWLLAAVHPDAAPNAAPAPAPAAGNP
jgi:endoglucanase